jgi:hypothetical protein
LNYREFIPNDLPPVFNWWVNEHPHTLGDFSPIKLSEPGFTGLKGLTGLRKSHPGNQSNPVNPGSDRKNNEYRIIILNILRIIITCL